MISGTCPYTGCNGMVWLGTPDDMQLPPKTMTPVLEKCSCCKKEIHTEDIRYFTPEIFKGFPFCLPCYCSIQNKADRIMEQAKIDNIRGGPGTGLNYAESGSYVDKKGVTLETFIQNSTSSDIILKSHTP